MAKRLPHHPFCKIGHLFSSGMEEKKKKTKETKIELLEAIISFSERTQGEFL